MNTVSGRRYSKVIRISVGDVRNPVISHGYKHPSSEQVMMTKKMMMYH
jgi:hypothetical protein